MFSIRSLFLPIMGATLLISETILFAAESPHTLKVLYITGGCCHDYQAQAPHIATNLSQIINVSFVIKFGLDSLANPKFADDYDAIFYNFCDEDAPLPVIEHALAATRNGK